MGVAKLIVGVFPISIKTDFPSHPLCWDALARRLWTGVDTATLIGRSAGNACSVLASHVALSDSDTTDSQVVELEKKTEQIFGEGLEAVGDGWSREFMFMLCVHP